MCRPVLPFRLYTHRPRPGHRIRVEIQAQAGCHDSSWVRISAKIDHLTDHSWNKDEARWLRATVWSAQAVACIWLQNNVAVAGPTRCAACAAEIPDTKSKTRCSKCIAAILCICRCPSATEHVSAKLILCTSTSVLSLPSSTLLAHSRSAAVRPEMLSTSTCTSNSTLAA